MSVVTLTVQAKKIAAVTSYSEVFETDFMRDIISNPESTLYSGGSAFTYPDTMGGFEKFIVSEDLTEIATASDGAIKKAVVVIPTGSVIGYKTTPVTLVAAPGAGKALIPVSGYGSIDYNSAAYATGTELDIAYAATPTIPLFTAAALLDVTADGIGLLRQTAATEAVITANSALVATDVTADPATGDSPLTVVLYYQEVTL